MKAIIFSCKYPQILPYFAKLWNKYFDSNIEAIILSPVDVDMKGMPDNFSHHKLSQFTRSWVDDISPFFESFKEELFFGCMEDHFLHGEVARNILSAGETLMLSDPNVGKFTMGGIPLPHYVKSWERDSEHIEFYFSDEYGFFSPIPIRQSLMPSLWRTDFFKLFLKHSVGYSAWEFEMRPPQDDYHLEPSVINEIRDYNTVYYPIGYPMIDLIRKGKSNERLWEGLLLPEDRLIFEEAISVTQIKEKF